MQSRDVLHTTEHARSSLHDIEVLGCILRLYYLPDDKDTGWNGKCPVICAALEADEVGGLEIEQVVYPL